ncbi:hypothetical protein ACFLYG_00250 [Chloroflexota bacterium]
MSKFEFQVSLIKYSENDYLDTLNRYLDKITQCQDVISVYQRGSVSHPGISDIDLLIVLKDEPGDFSWQKYSIKTLSEKDQYIFVHEPMVISESLAGKIKYFFPVFQIERLWGKSFDFVEPPSQAYIHFLIEFFIEGYMSWPYVLMKKREMRRLTIPQIWSTNHSTRVFEQIYGAEAKFNEMKTSFWEKSLLLKGHFFELSQQEAEEMIEDLAYQAKHIYNYILRCLDKHIEQNLNRSLPWFIYTGFKPRVVLFNSIIKNRETAIIRFLPTSFSVILREKYYSELKNPELRNSFAERAKYVRDYEKFRSTNNFGSKFAIFSHLYHSGRRLGVTEGMS